MAELNEIEIFESLKHQGFLIILCVWYEINIILFLKITQRIYV